MTFSKKKQVYIENFQTKNKLFICQKHYCPSKYISIGKYSNSFYLSKTRLPPRIYVKNKIACQNICQSGNTQTVSICQKQDCLPEYMSIAKYVNEYRNKKFFIERGLEIRWITKTPKGVEKFVTKK